VYIMNANEDVSEQADDETEEIVFKVPSISEVYYSIAYFCFGKQRYQFVRNNNGIEKYFPIIKQSTITGLFIKKIVNTIRLTLYYTHKTTHTIFFLIVNT